MAFLLAMIKTSSSCCEIGFILIIGISTSAFSSFPKMKYDFGSSPGYSMTRLKVSGAKPESSNVPFLSVLAKPKRIESFSRTAIIDAWSRVVTPVVSYTVPVTFID